jgi:ATP-dependent RNA circularization protein (DNA/RNA ligase family)
VIDFFRFPRTPHLAWLGEGAPRDDKVLTPTEAKNLLLTSVLVEEKLDGANLGISVDERGELRVQNRGQFLVRPFGGQFSRIESWLDQHRHALARMLGSTLIVFGEWCAARHSIAYTGLPDWFIAFDVYDRSVDRFWSARRRDGLMNGIGLATVPRLAEGRMTLARLENVVLRLPSRFGAPHVEGVIVRRDTENFLERRAKLVHPAFAGAIGDHWRRRRIEWNLLVAI